MVQTAQLQEGPGMHARRSGSTRAGRRSSIKLEWPRTLCTFAEPRAQQQQLKRQMAMTDGAMGQGAGASAISPEGEERSQLRSSPMITMDARDQCRSLRAQPVPGSRHA